MKCLRCGYARALWHIGRCDNTICTVCGGHVQCGAAALSHDKSFVSECKILCYFPNSTQSTHIRTPAMKPCKGNGRNANNIFQMHSLLDGRFWWPKTPTHRIVRNRPYIDVKCKTNAKQICRHFLRLFFRKQNQYLIQHRYLMCNLRQNFICFYSDRIKLNRIRSTAEGQLTIVVCKLVIFNGFARVDLIKTIAVRLQRIAVARLLAARFHDVSAEEVLKQFRRRASVSRLQRTPLTVHVLDEVAAVIA